MDQDVTKVYFAILRSAIGADKLTADELSGYSSDALRDMLKLSGGHDVTHLLAMGLKNGGLLPKENQSAEKSILKAVYRYEKLEHEFVRLCDAFENAEIPYVPLKGAVLREYYPEKWMRTSCDVDVLVHEEDVDKAVKTLVGKLGWKADHKRDYHDISLYSPSGVHVELHFSIKEKFDAIDGLLDEVWDHCVCKEGFKYAMTSEFFVFYHVAHMSYHFIEGGCGIKPFIDLYIIKNKLSFDEDTVRGYCRQCGIEAFLDNVLYLTDVWFADAVHTKTSRKIEDYVLRGGVYGSFENRTAVAKSKKNGSSNYVLSRLFVPYDVLKNYFPVLERHKWLTPFMQVARWFRIFGNGKLKRGIKEIKISQSISKATAEDMGEFLKSIGL